MRTTCWNCQGVGNTLTVRHLRDIYGQYVPEVVFLSETKNRRSYLETVCSNLGYFDICTVEPEGIGGGLALMWKEEVNVSILEKCNRFIDTKIIWQDKEFYLTGVYGYPVPSERHKVWEQLSCIGLNRNNPWILLGDFNEIISNEDKRGGAPRSERSFYDFRNFLNTMGLSEVTYQGNALSWYGFRSDGLVHCKLDRVVANVEWQSMFPEATSYYLPRIGSDHSPIASCFDGGGPRRRGQFRYDKRWLKKEGFKEAIRAGWTNEGSEAVGGLVDKISACRRAMSQWKKRAQPNSEKQIQELKRKLDSLTHGNTLDLPTFQQLKNDLHEVYKEEAAFWRMSSRITWMQHGDKNSKYFHSVAKQRRSYNKIHYLESEEGTKAYAEIDMGNTAAQYFTTLFQSEIDQQQDMIHSTLFEGIQRVITNEQNETLMKEVTEEEIGQAVFQLGPDRSPGPDGLSGAFYQTHWDIIRQDIVKMVRGFMEEGSLDGRLNETHICLIPKKPHPHKLSEFRPISLCNFAYKIISKVLSTRLKSILPQIVSENQAAFVSGRLISDNILIAHEMIHALRTKENVASEFLAMKTDMMKAYDMLEWPFIEKTLHLMGFSSEWIKRIMFCITSVSYRVLINGQAVGSITPSRGIRQGDPLSPFLFIVCAEVLASALRKAENEERISGIKIAEHAPPISQKLEYLV